MDDHAVRPRCNAESEFSESLRPAPPTAEQKIHDSVRRGWVVAHEIKPTEPHLQSARYWQKQ